MTKPGSADLTGGAGGAEQDAPLSYNEYLKVAQLLAAQQLRSDPAHHDEMLFIIIHQTYELWFRLILHEFDSAAQLLADDDTFTAERRLLRVKEIQRVLLAQIHILETMTPTEFLAFRDHLKPASGFQSAQFREIEFATGLKDRRVLASFHHEPDTLARLEARLAAPSIGDRFYELLTRRGLAVPPQPARDAQEYTAWCETAISRLLEIYQNPRKHYDLFRLAESLIEIDEYLNLWRYHHVRMVERMVGFKYGTGGSEGVRYLERTTQMKSFPEMWQARTHIEANSQAGNQAGNHSY